MSHEPKHIIVSYDISDPLRLARIGKAMEDYGTRVLKSIFECTLDDSTFTAMRAHMERLMENELDSVRYYALCKKCLKRAQTIGKREHKPADDSEVIII